VYQSVPGGLQIAVEVCDVICLRRLVCVFLPQLFPERNLQVRRIERAAGDTYSENKNANTDVLSTETLRALGWKPGVTIEEGFRRTVLSFEKEMSQP